MTSAARLQAMYDDAMSDPRGLECISNEALLKKVVKYIAQRLPPEAIIERVRYTECPARLLLYVGSLEEKRPDMFKDIALKLSENNHGLDVSEMEIFSDEYWTIFVRKWLIKGDHRRAWDELKRAMRGFSKKESEPWQPPVVGDAFDIAASITTLCELVAEIHAAMVGKGLLMPITQAQAPDPDRWWGYHHPVPRVAGRPMVAALHGAVGDSIDRVGQMVIAIAGYLNRERNRRRAAHIAAKAASEDGG